MSDPKADAYIRAGMNLLELELQRVINSRNPRAIRNQVRKVLHFSHKANIGVPSALVTLLWDAFNEVDAVKDYGKIDLLARHEDHGFEHDMWFAAAAYYRKAKDKKAAIKSMCKKLPDTDASTIRKWCKFDASVIDLLPNYRASREFLECAKAYRAKKGAKS